MNADPSSPDLYERLGVSTDAGPEEIKAAFKAMRKELHPDSRPEPLRGHFDAMMKNANEAHQTLTNSRARAKYDARRRSSDQSGQGHGQSQTQQSPPGPEARERASQEEQARRRQREEHQHHTGADSGATSDSETDDAEDWEWSEEPESGAADATRQKSQRAAPRESLPYDGPTLIDRIPAPVHRAAIYVTGSWLWLVMGALIWRLPFAGSQVLVLLGGLFIPLILGIVLLKTAGPLAALGRMIGHVSPGVSGRYWYARRIAESVALAPVVRFLGVWLAGPLLGWSAIAAVAYVGVWVAEYLRQRKITAG